MDNSVLVKSLRALAQATDGILEKEMIAHADVAPVQQALEELQRKPLSEAGVDLAIANTVLRLRIKLTDRDFAVPPVDTGTFSLGRLFSRPVAPEEAARRQQAAARKTLVAFRKELGNILFAMVI